LSASAPAAARKTCAFFLLLIVAGAPIFVAMSRFSLLVLLSVLASCTSFYSTDDFGRVPKIDTHVHLNAWITAVEEQAEQDNFQLLNINVDVPSYPPMPEQRKLARWHNEKFPDRVRFLSAFDLKNWNDFDWQDRTIESLDSSFKQGAIGIKVWKNIGMVYRDSAGAFIMIDNPRFDPVINFVISKNKTVMGHLGEPRNCWLPLDQMTVNNDRNYFRDHPEYHMFLHPEYPTYEQQIAARDNFLARHPDIRFVGAHLGSLEWNLSELGARLDRFPGMAVDMAARIPHLQHLTVQDHKAVRAFFIKYQDRLIYATDTSIGEEPDDSGIKSTLHDTWLAHWKYFVTEDEMTAPEVTGSFNGLHLPTEVVDKIYYHNAIRWFQPGW
jgi:hypothetical protein